MSKNKKKSTWGEPYKIKIKERFGCTLFDEYAENFEDVKKVFERKEEKLG